ncbi:hypothetical protein B0J11DRAFT_511997 [Dendryphion nanum]|uniref:Uncharacterized protein n=1 Tax=Dendryphion nanum TaxID=256645 RepID=A0A9P9D3U1_9PLEO|nr:hypothetical protein B0J11DRAFT_511997 [Dendryphion nanum]
MSSLDQHSNLPASNFNNQVDPADGNHSDHPKSAAAKEQSGDTTNNNSDNNLGLPAEYALEIMVPLSTGFDLFGTGSSEAPHAAVPSNPAIIAIGREDESMDCLTPATSLLNGTSTNTLIKSNVCPPFDVATLHLERLDIIVTEEQDIGSDNETHHLTPAVSLPAEINTNTPIEPSAFPPIDVDRLRPEWIISNGNGSTPNGLATNGQVAANTGLNGSVFNGNQPAGRDFYNGSAPAIKKEDGAE